MLAEMIVEVIGTLFYVFFGGYVIGSAVIAFKKEDYRWFGVYIFMAFTEALWLINTILL